MSLNYHLLPLHSPAGEGELIAGTAPVVRGMLHNEGTHEAVGECIIDGPG